ncbi:MAG TPA: amidohydrolase family protein, partial [Gemmatimonadaceae bacterium]|nr:amidohydrolase family protein [Gemmatimonadaceae bacterium]
TALRMWTENVTWFSNEEGKKGRIEVGQLADLIVPDRDYLSCPETEIVDITAHLTVVGGEIVYGAGEFAHLDEATPPPAMPDWSPVRRFGGYAAWDDRERSTAKAAIPRVASACGRVHARDVRDFTSLWGALGCACWAV